MEELKKQKIGLFRVRVIASLIGLRREDRGRKEKVLQDISEREVSIYG